MIDSPPTSRLHHFACPVCGRARAISPRALRAIKSGIGTGECRAGEGCRAELNQQELLRRWWLKKAGVDPMLIRRAGGAVAYVQTCGFPDRLWRIACAASDIPDIYFSRPLVEQIVAT